MTVPEGRDDGSEQSRLIIRRTILLEDAKAAGQLSGDLLKWSLASLLVINGGALVALLRVEELRTSLFSTGGWFFGAGLLSALLGGFSLSLYFQHGANGLLERAWREDPLGEDTYAEVLLPGKDAQAWGAVGLLLLVLSLILFVGGCWSVSTALPAPAP